MLNKPRVELIDAVCELPNVGKSRAFTFKIQRGELVLLSGLNADERTAVFNLIACLAHPISGEVLIEGTCINGFTEQQAKDLRDCLGLMMPAFPLIDNLTVFENVKAATETVQGNPSPVDNRVILALKLCGIHELATKRPNELTVTQRHLTYRARAIVNRPAVMLVDDFIFSEKGCDSQMLMDSVAKYVRIGTTIVIATNSKLVPQEETFRRIVF